MHLVATPSFIEGIMKTPIHRGNNMPSLALIMPVFNEEEAIAGVIAKWSAELQRLGIDYAIHVYDGGSRDRTLPVINALAAGDGRLHVHATTLLHGPSILLGYRENAGCDWLFQTDSDDEMDVSFFERFWNQRANYDFLIGSREGRESPFFRRFISFFSRMMVRIFYGPGVRDVNSPFRLFRTAAFRDAFLSMPADTLAPNVILSGMACLQRLRILEIPVAHRTRATGVSINKSRLLKAAAWSFYQMVRYRITR